MLTATVMTTSKSAVNDYGWQFARDNPEVTTRFLRGDKMRNLQAAFAEMAAALQFPWYFGENMAALVDCLGDLSWLSDDIQLIIYDAELVLAEGEDDKRSFYGAIKRAAEEFGRAGNPLHPDRMKPALFQVVFQCEAGKLDDVKTDVLLLGSGCEVIAG